MVRTISYDRSEALDNAVELFWSIGYESSSISRLTKAMKINRSSLYSEFGGKRALFDEVLARYMDILEENLFTPTLRGMEDPKAAVEAFFQQAFLNANPDTLRYGCLFFNVLGELNAFKPELAALSKNYLGTIRKLFFDRLEESQRLGYIEPHQNISLLTDYIMTLLAGLRIQCKARSSRCQLEKLIQLGLDHVFPQRSRH